jgi:orotidine-5'-phosphate decarboxylase
MKPAKDYLIFPLDVSAADAAKQYVELLGEYVGVFKVGLELFIRCGLEVIAFIHATRVAGVFVDLKLHDIPATVSRAMTGIADLGIQFATVHCGESPRMLAAAVAGSQGKVDILGVTVLTSVSAADIKTAGYRQQFYADISRLVLQKAAMAKTAGCAGVVCSGHEARMIKEKLGKGFLAVTPGIRPQWSVEQSDDQQRVVTPAQAVRNGADFLVIGRPIRDAKDPRAAAERIAEEIQAVI